MSSNVRVLTTAVMAAVGLSTLPLALPTAATAAAGAQEPPGIIAPEQQEARYLVRYTRGADVATRAKALRSQGVGVKGRFSHAVRAVVVQATPAQATSLARSPRVASVEVDRPMHIDTTQNPAPWGLDRMDQRNLPLSGSYTAPASGAGVSAYVVDTGIRADHIDFGDRVAAGWTTVADGRGTTDCNGHGTHVAGTIAGSTYGAAKAATIVPVRVLDCDGYGYMSDVVAGLDWVAAHHTAGSPAVVNVSLGGAASSTVDAALQGVIDDGVTAVVAAGNSGADACNTSPARVPHALTVAASDSADRQASFSNHGGCVDLYAPGVSIVSSWYTSSTATANLSGTSMASPHTAGAAAVLLAQDPALGPAQVASTLTDRATTGVVTSVSTGTPNRLLYLPATAVSPSPFPATEPAAATGVRATAGRRSASVAWTKGSDGGSPLTGQLVSVYSGSQTVRTVAVSASATRASIRNLKPRVSYAFTVTATNEIGAGPESDRSNSVTVRR